MLTSRFVVGIDLGTTNSALCYVDTALPEAERAVVDLPVPQVVAAGEAAERPLLPSAVYLPGEHELAAGALDLPWAADPPCAVGAFARDHGATIPQRLVASAKSWLCHHGIDRRAAVLPWGAEPGAPQLSPVAATARVLEHLRDAWNHQMARDDDGLRLERQQVTLTVPASFDAVARDLTVEAAGQAGLENLTLLEEPQAAIYAWIKASGEGWRRQVQKGDVVLVCDVGGGTSDFSLISVEEEEGELSLRRVAVGDHLLVGGDNFDLALARTVEQGLGARLDAWQLAVAWHAAREAKERLLSSNRAKSAPVVIPGRSSKLVGGTLKGELTREQVSSIILDGFFPSVPASDRPRKAAAAGLAEMGLPYVQDPAISKHLAAFLGAHVPKGSGAALAHPTAILFNGGVFKPTVMRDRVREVVGRWMAEDDGAEPRELEGVDLDLAVARGAALYGLVRRGQGIRIRGGTARSYYVGVEVPMPAVPGMAPPVRALCVAPFGMEEGTEADLTGRRFGLTVGEPAHFRFFSSTTRPEDRVGTAVDDPTAHGLEEVEPIETTMASDAVEAGTTVPVTLRSAVTEVGTLQLWAVSVDRAERFRLEFGIRDQKA